MLPWDTAETDGVGGDVEDHGGHEDPGPDGALIGIGGGLGGRDVDEEEG